MSRMSNLIDRIEKLAKKFGCSIEEVVDILEGKHPTHCVTAKPEPAAEKAATTGNVSAAGPVETTNPAPAIQSAGADAGNVASSTVGGVSTDLAGVEAGTANSQA